MMMIVQARRLERQLEESLAELGLSLRTFGVLGHLRRAPGLSFSEVARRAGITAQSVQVTMKILEASGFIVVDGAGRGRRAVVSLTDLGRERMAAAFAAIGELDAEVFGQPGWHDLGRELEELGRAARFARTTPASNPATD